MPEWDETKFQGYQSQRQRPLPSPPVEKDEEVSSMPWYKEVDRKKGEELLKNGVDGYFLIRPSSKGEACLTLTLWFHNRVYNIPIRKRGDKKFALGTPKANEQVSSSFRVLPLESQEFLGLPSGTILQYSSIF